jgi:tetratricopeptide (TPR) repeat protein
MVVAPFYAATSAAKEEGEAMRQMLFTSLAETLEGEKRFRVMNVETGSAPRTEGEALALGKTLYADVVIWGRAVTMRGETRIEPKVTVLEEKRSEWDYKERKPDIEALETSSEEKNPIRLTQAKAQEVRNLGLILAASYLARKDEPRAMELLKKVPTAKSLCEQGAIAQSYNGAEALKLYEQALEKNPRMAEAHFRIANIYSDRVFYRKGDPEQAFGKAVYHYQQALAADPSVIGAYFFLARLFLWKGQMDEAAAVVKEGIQHVQDPDFSPFLWFFEIYEMQGKYEEMKALLEEFLKKSPNDIGVNVELARLLEWQNRPEKAMELLRAVRSGLDGKWPAANPRTWGREPGPAAELASAFANMALYEEAVGVLASAFGDGHPRTMLDSRADYYCGLQQYDRARKIISRSLARVKRSKTWGKLEESIAIAFGFQKDYADRYYEYERFTNPDQQAQYWRCRVSLFEGKSEETVKLFRESGIVSETYEGNRASLLLATALYLKREYAPAIPLLEKWEEEERFFDGLLLYCCQVKSGNKAQAEKALEKLKTKGAERWDLIQSGKYFWDQPGNMEFFLAFLAGKVSEQEISGYTQTHVLLWGIWKRPWECELNYYLGAYNAVSGNTEKAKDYLRRSVGTGMRDKLEWLLAEHELEQLNSRQGLLPVQAPFPPTVISETRKEGLLKPPRMSRSLATLSMLFRISSAEPPSVRPSTGKAGAPSTIQKPLAPTEKFPVVGSVPSPRSPFT